MDNEPQTTPESIEQKETPDQKESAESANEPAPPVDDPALTEEPESVPVTDEPAPSNPEEVLPEPELQPEQDAAEAVEPGETSVTPDEEEAEEEQLSDLSGATGEVYRDILATPVPSESAVAAHSIDLSGIENAQSNLSHQVFDLSERVNALNTANSAMVADIHKISEEAEQLVSWSQHVQVTSALSKIFQVVAIIVLAALLGGISFMGIMQYRYHARLNAAEAALAEALKLQEKRLADYDKHFADLVGKELKVTLETRQQVSIHERLNKLRNGNAEQKIYRKNSGDWFVFSEKSEQNIPDPEIIEVLNHAYTKSGKQLVTRSPMPPHRLWGVLKGNGQGGTEIVITSEVTP